MGSITLTNPVAGTEAQAGIIATNFSLLQTLLNGQLDEVNIDPTADLDNNARVGVRKDSAGSTFERRRLNFIQGSGVTLTVADDSGNEEVDITIASSGGTFIGARVTHSGGQTVAAGTNYLSFDTETFDTDTMHDTVTNNTRIKATTAGKYLIGGGFVLTTADGDTQAGAVIRFNGTTQIASQLSRSGVVATAYTLSTIYDFTANQYVELGVVHASAGNEDVSAQQFWMYKIG